MFCEGVHRRYSKTWSQGEWSEVQLTVCSWFFSCSLFIIQSRTSIRRRWGASRGQVNSNDNTSSTLVLLPCFVQPGPSAHSPSSSSGQALSSTYPDYLVPHCEIKSTIYCRSVLYSRDMHSLQTLSTHVHFKIMSLTSGWQIAKGGKGTLFCSQITVYDGKGRTVQ